uniref:Uncharacterized protein n=1 Tax=Mycena chlorophos TaxID=658473 RepID=A0ABQ0LKJ5_MYCCL|nr:predicted protein [Mycena chlorophos]
MRAGNNLLVADSIRGFQGAARSLLATGQAPAGSNGSANLGCPESISPSSASSAGSTGSASLSFSTSTRTSSGPTRTSTSILTGTGSSVVSDSKTITTSSIQTQSNSDPTSSMQNSGSSSLSNFSSSLPIPSSSSLSDSLPIPTTTQIAVSSARHPFPAAAIAGTCIAIVILLLAAAFAGHRLLRNRRMTSPRMEAFLAQPLAAGQVEAPTSRKRGLPSATPSTGAATSSTWGSTRQTETTGSALRSESLQMRNVELQDLQARMRVLEETVLYPQSPPSYRD